MPDKCSGNNDDTNKLMVAMIEKESPEEDLFFTARYTAYINYSAAAHIVKYDTILSEGKVLMSTSIRTVRSEVVKGTSWASRK